MLNGVTVSPDGSITIGDHDNPALSISGDEVRAYIGKRSLSQVNSWLASRAQQVGFYAKVMSLDPPRVAVSSTQEGLDGVS